MIWTFRLSYIYLAGLVFGIEIASSAGFTANTASCPIPRNDFSWKSTAGRWYHKTGGKSFSAAKEYCSGISGAQLITLDNPYDVTVAYEYHSESMAIG